MHNPLLNIAFRAARSASKIILDGLEHLDRISIERKGCNDFVTEIDKKVEEEIVKIIYKSYPDHAIIGEEGGSDGEGEYTWIIDPIDGTLNFIHGHPHFCTAIAVQHKKKIQCGLIYDVVRDELFTASKGGGAYLNNKRIRVRSENRLDNAVCVTSCSSKCFTDISDYTKLLQVMLPQFASMRCSGSAALDLAYVASGRFDCLMEMNLKLWDIAAGSLLVKEAGGLVSDFNGEDKYLSSGNIIAGNSSVFKKMIKLLAPLRSSDKTA